MNRNGNLTLLLIFKDFDFESFHPSYPLCTVDIKKEQVCKCSDFFSLISIDAFTKVRCSSATGRPVPKCITYPVWEGTKSLEKSGIVHGIIVLNVVNQPSRIAFTVQMPIAKPTILSCKTIKN